MNKIIDWVGDHPAIGMCLLCGALISLPVFGPTIEAITLNNVPVVVTVDGKEIFRGPSYLVATGSRGTSTFVQIRNRVFAGALVYEGVSSDVKVTPIVEAQ